MTAFANGPQQAPTQAPQEPQAQDPFTQRASEDVQTLLHDVQVQTLYAALVDARAEVHRLSAQVAQLQKPKARAAAKKRTTPAKKTTAKKP